MELVLEFLGVCRGTFEIPVIGDKPLRVPGYPPILKFMAYPGFEPVSPPRIETAFVNQGFFRSAAQICASLCTRFRVHGILELFRFATKVCHSQVLTRSASMMRVTAREELRRLG
jgi:hypothetical protein